MSSPTMQRATGTPRKLRAGSGSSAGPVAEQSPSKRTPQKLQVRSRKPIEEDVPEEPATPSPKPRKTMQGEQRDVPEETQSQASGSVGGLAGGLSGQVKDTAGALARTGQQTVATTTGVDLSFLKGLEVSEWGQVLGDDGNPVGRIVEGEPQDLVGYAVGDNGEILDDDGDLIGRVEALPEAIEENTGQATKAIAGLAELNGIPVSEGGFIKDEAGEIVGKVVEGDAQDLVGHVPNEKGEILDGEGDLVGRVEPVSKPTSASSATGSRRSGSQGTKSVGKSVSEEGTGELDKTASETKEMESTAEEKAEDAQEQLPPLSTLEGLKCNKLGKIINPSTGKPVGELVEGDPKKLTRLGATLDDQGQFWDNRGNVIGRAQTLPQQEYSEEPPFAGLDGLHVVEDGWVEDNKGKRVGKIVDGEPKKVLGRPVDEDGEVTDQHGNVIAKAEYYEQPDEPEPEEPEVVDLSRLDGLTCNKLGYVMGPNGVPIARVVEGNPKELAGKEIDDGQIWDGRKPIGRVELIPENEREKKPEGPFAGLENLVVNKEGFVQDTDGNIVGQVTEGDLKNLRGRSVDEDGDIIDKFGNVKGHAEPYEPPEEEVVEADLSILEGKIVNKAGNVVDAQGNVFGRITSGDKRLAGRKVDGTGQIWGDDGKVIGKAELVPGAEQEKPEGAFFGFDDAEVGKDGVVTSGGKIIGRVIEGDAKRLQGRKVDEDGDILDKNGNTIGRAERWEPEEKQRSVNPMAGRKVTREGEVRDVDGNLIGKLTSGNLATLVGKEIDDNGFVVDNDGNKLGECTLLENLPEEEEDVVEEEPGPSPEELEEQKKAEEDKQLAKKMSAIIGQTLDRVRPICKMITEHIERAERTPKEELDEERLVKDVKPLLEEGGRILQECNGAIRALDPDGRIAATAKARAASHEASPEEYALADQIKEMADTVVSCIENGKKKIADMPHAKRQLNPLWALLSEPLFQIIAAVGLLLTGVLGLVGRLLEGLGLGPLVHRLLGGLGLDKLLDSLGLTSITDALGITGKKK
ncbi:LEA domain protein [Aspergillus bombycis]|uniref:LEA domain protein n=1 Tax=Aspergillus bombycis TaxID=109264 RepID=A0A1F7ZTK2_9EURO|nr:LEA domain protein [Aspergillus bombycis]OGM42783.1 LEA domain protein [Aspergillus bombycis]